MKQFCSGDVVSGGAAKFQGVGSDDVRPAFAMPARHEYDMKDRTDSVLAHLRANGTESVAA
jgi:hypothetical protein